MKHASHEDMEAALYAWFKQACTLNVPGSGPILMEKASEISKSMGLDFTLNGGWLERFKQRKAVIFHIISGEPAAALKQDAETWTQKPYRSS